MNPDLIQKLLEEVRTGNLEVGAAMERLKSLPFEDLGFAKVDLHRRLRRGAAEVVYAEGKSPEQVIAIVERLLGAGQNVLVTRVTPEMYVEVAPKLPGLHYNATARTMVKKHERHVEVGNVMVLCAGTSDMPVAEEAAVTAEVLGSRVERAYDVGVAGMHRLLAQGERLTKARVLVVCAGMEGALPSVVAGLVAVPVIAVPTSVGYGASFGGLAALLAMLNSCASGVSVVNIDNGFGAGYLAHLINTLPPVGE